MRIRYQPYGSLSFLAESFVMIICNSVYPPQKSIIIYHNQLQIPIIKRLSLSAETAVLNFLIVNRSTLDDASFSWMFLSLGC